MFPPCFFFSVFGVFAFLAARVSASRLSLRVFSSLRFNSVKIGERPPGLVFPGGRLCAWRACGCLQPRLLFGGEELRHVVCCRLAHVVCGVEAALSVVEWPVGGAFFGVCAVPGFAEVLCAAVGVTERGFGGVLSRPRGMLIRCWGRLSRRVNCRDD